MVPEDAGRKPMDKKTLIITTAGGLVAAVLIVAGAILPAEFNKDPTKLGKLTGLSRLWAPEEKTLDLSKDSVKRARYYNTAYRSDVVEIPLTGPGGGIHGPELEYKVRMAKDATLVYSWEVVAPKAKDEVHYDFHGHTTPDPMKGVGMDVAAYKVAYGNSGGGALTSPFDGINGWQFTNTTDNPIVIRVRLAGYYTLIEPGDAGNEEGVLANLPAAKSRPWLTNPTPSEEDLSPLPKK